MKTGKNMPNIIDRALSKKLTDFNIWQKIFRTQLANK